MKNRYLPFGYKIADGKIVADSEQVEAVRRIFDAYTAGQTFQQIADALSAQGIPYRSDALRWNKNMVSRGVCLIKFLFPCKECAFSHAVLGLCFHE